MSAEPFPQSVPLPGYEAARGGAALFDVSDRGRLDLVGPDAAAFLHNLSTADIKGLADGAGREFFLTTAKAKVLAHGWAHRTGTNLSLDVDPGSGAKVAAQLDRFLISENVEIFDRTAESAQLRLAGPDAESVVIRALGGATHEVRRTTALGVPAFDVVCAAADVADVRQQLIEAGAIAAGPDLLEVLRVEAGTPEYGKDVDEDRFVVEVGRTDAVSTAKGCYVGQEPIVMARDRAGFVQRLLMGVLLPDGRPVPPNSRLMSDGQEAGLVTTSVLSPRLGALGLAYVRRKHQTAGAALQVEVGDELRPAVVAALPFA